MGLELVIVDDAPFIREAIRNCAEAMGIDVIAEAGNGSEAIKILESHSPDLVILDLVMPELNGLQVAEKILSEKPNMKIIACSTQSQKDMMLKALEVGCKSFLTKPFTVDQLKEKITSAMKA